METVESWKDIEKNLQEFKKIGKNPQSHTARKLGTFYNWYYFPKQEIFAPGKFLGTRNATLNTYYGEGHGTLTKDTLAKYFKRLKPNSHTFKELHKKLEVFLNEYGKNVNKKVSEAYGGIYVIHQGLDKITSEEARLIKISMIDLDAVKAEWSKPALLKEGKKKQTLVNLYERKPSVRANAIHTHGLDCCVCGFNFEKVYGKHGANYIEVHHLKPLYLQGKSVLVNPKKDMAVVCANCHRMIHRKKDKPLSPSQLKKMILQAKKSSR